MEKFGRCRGLRTFNRSLQEERKSWKSISPFVMTLAYGGSDIYEGWMKNKKSAMISCNDGFRPVSFYIEVLED